MKATPVRIIRDLLHEVKIKGPSRHAAMWALLAVGLSTVAVVLSITSLVLKVTQ